ncbi:MAG: tetratricopeptide repeat protein [Alphaproteobacteria bacterium]|nr:tetratricopeptide repeat protein [Alphaproteobacteria bacterium]
MADDTDPVEALLQRALGHYQSGDVTAAEALVREALAQDPDRPAAHHFLGVLALGDGRLDLAIVSIGRAIQLRPNEAQCHSNLGNAFLAAGRLAEAEASYREALRLAPEAAQVHYNLGALLAQRGHHEDAAASFRTALNLQPDFPEARTSLATTLCIAGDALIGLARFDEAAAACTEALQLQPDFAEAHATLANALFGLERYGAAEASCQAALRLKPDLAAALQTLANTLLAQGRIDEATAQYERVLAVQPGHADARIGLCVAQLGAAWRDEAEIQRRRAAYERELKRLAEDVERGVVPDLASGIGLAQPFFLPYQGLDDRTLQSLYGNLVCKVMGERFPPLPAVPPPRPGEKIRLGIVSGFFRRHSNWKIPIKGWLTQLDRHRFHVTGYHTGTIQDAETKVAAGLCDRFVQGPLTVAAWRDQIAADAPHVLIYPEIGIDPIAVQLASQRLAQVQCNSWGQPVTSGMPTLDYYLSSELMEPPAAQALYTERLVALPHLSIYYEPVADEALPAIDRAQLGLRPGAVAYWSGQTLSKYLPRYDDLFPRIARDAPDCQFVFLEFAKGRHVTELFRERLARAFAALGLDAARHCVFLPRLSEPQFRAALGQCDAILDSVGWSGCNSTLESLVHNLPIVTLPTEFMRGRHTFAILRRMGVEDTIAATPDDYVSLAVRLAHDPAWRAAVSAKIAANKARLYRDRACITALEDFLVSAVRGQSP